MSSSESDARVAQAQAVSLTDDTLLVDLADGRTVSAPLSWYPRLAHASPEERSEFRLIGQGEGIHWPRLDEDINIEDLLAGRPSGESQRSLRAWMRERERAS